MLGYVLRSGERRANVLAWSPSWQVQKKRVMPQTSCCNGGTEREGAGRKQESLVWVALISRGPGLEAPIWLSGLCPCDHTPPSLAPPSQGCWRSRAPQPSPRLMVPSLGDSCSPNPLGLLINQDEMRVTVCERQTLSGSMTESTVLSVHVDARDLAGHCHRHLRPPGRGRVGGVDGQRTER